MKLGLSLNNNTQVRRVVLFIIFFFFPSMVFASDPTRLIAILIYIPVLILSVISFIMVFIKRDVTLNISLPLIVILFILLPWASENQKLGEVGYLIFFSFLFNVLGLIVFFLLKKVIGIKIKNSNR